MDGARLGAIGEWPKMAADAGGENDVDKGEASKGEEDGGYEGGYLGEAEGDGQEVGEGHGGEKKLLVPCTHVRSRGKSLLVSSSEQSPLLAGPPASVSPAPSLPALPRSPAPSRRKLGRPRLHLSPLPHPALPRRRPLLPPALLPRRRP